MFSIFFGHWATVSLTFAYKKCGRISFEGRNLNCWHFSAFKRKNSNFFSKRFCTRMSQLLTTYPDENFETFFLKILFSFITFGTWREVFRTMREKNFAWAQFLRLLAQVFRLACQNSKVFVQLSSLKLLKNIENHRGSTWETFWNFRIIWIHVEHRARNFLPFDKKFTVGRFKADFHVSREKNWRKNVFLKDSGTLTKSSLGS